MNVIKFNTNKAKGEFLVVPNGAANFRREQNPCDLQNYNLMCDVNGKEHYLGRIYWRTQILNLSNQLSEEQMELVCECQSKPLSLYKNYVADTGYMEHLCRTVSDSYATLKKSLNVIDENKFGDEPTDYNLWRSGQAVAFLIGTNDKMIEWEQVEKLVKSYLVLLEVK